MALEAGQIGQSIGPAVQQTVDLLWIVGQIVVVILIILYILYLMTYSIPIIVEDFTKGRRTITYTTRAKEYRDKKTGTVKIKTVGRAGFGGDKINQPPSECIFPFRGFGAKKSYKFIRKDGLYYPIKNYVLGKETTIDRQQVEAATDEEREKLSEQLVGLHEIEGDKHNYHFYTIDGTGLEIARDYDAEEAIQNNLESMAVKYRNKKPTEMVAGYAMFIISIICATVIIVYVLGKVDDVVSAIGSLGGPVEQAVESSLAQRLGPG